MASFAECDRCEKNTKEHPNLKIKQLSVWGDDDAGKLELRQDLCGSCIKIVMRAIKKALKNK